MFGVVTMVFVIHDPMLGEEDGCLLVPQCRTV